MTKGFRTALGRAEPGICSDVEHRLQIADVLLGLFEQRPERFRHVGEAHVDGLFGAIAIALELGALELEIQDQCLAAVGARRHLGDEGGRGAAEEFDLLGERGARGAVPARRALRAR